MPSKVQLPDNSVIEFPDGMSVEQMNTAVKSHLEKQAVSRITADTAKSAIGDAANARMAENTGLTIALAEGLPEDLSKGAEYANKAIGGVISAAANVPIDFVNSVIQVTGTGKPIERLDTSEPLISDEAIFQAREIGYQTLRDIGVPHAAARGAANALSSTVQGFSSIESLATLPLLEFRAGRAAIATLMALESPKQIKDTIKTIADPNATSAQKWEAFDKAGVNLAMTVGLALHKTPKQVKSQFTPEEAAKRAESITPLSDAVMGDVLKTPEDAKTKTNFQYSSPESKAWWEKKDQLQKQYNDVVADPSTEGTSARRDALKAMEEHDNLAYTPEGRQAGLNKRRINSENPLERVNATTSEFGSIGQRNLTGWRFNGEWETAENGENFRRVISPDGKERAVVWENTIHPLEKSALEKNTTQSGEVQPSAANMPLAPNTATALSEVLTTEQPKGGDLADESSRNIQGQSPDVNQTEQQGSQTPRPAEQRQEGGPTDGMLQVTQPEAGTPPASESVVAKNAPTPPTPIADQTVKNEGVKKTPKGKVEIKVKNPYGLAAEGDKTQNVTGNVFKVDGLPDHDFVVYKTGRGWRSVEKETGLSPGDTYGKTKSESISKTKASVSKIGADMTKLAIERAEKLNPNEATASSSPTAPKVEGKVETPASPTPPPSDVGKGMGGAIPSEFEPVGGIVTSTKNATVDDERAKRGLPPAIQPLRRSFGEVWDRAMAKLDHEPWILDGRDVAGMHNPGLIEELRDKPRALTDQEDALLLHRQVDLQNEYGKAARDLKQAYDDGREEAVGRESDRLNAISEKLQELYDITKSSGTETGRGLNARKMMADEHFNLAEMEMGLRAAREGRPITDAERAQLADLEKRHKELSDQLAEAQAKQREAETQAAVEKLRADEASKPKPLDPSIKRIFDKFKTGAQKAGDAAEARINARRKEGRLFAGLDPAEQLDYALWGLARITEGVIDKGTWAAQMVAKWGDQLKPHIDAIWEQSTKMLEDAVEPKDEKKKAGVRKAMEDMDTTEVTKNLTEKIGEKIKAGKKDEITNLVQRLARNFVKGGITEREPLVDAVHGVINGIDPSIERRETMDMISGYGDYKPLTKEAVAVKLRDLKGQMQQVAKLEDMQAGKPPLKTGIQRREISKSESELIKKVNDAKRDFQVPNTDPESQLQSSLDTLKKRMQTRLDELNRRMKENDFAKVEKKPITLDSAATKLKLELNKVQLKYRDMLEAERLKNRDKWEKFWDKIVQLRRGFLLSYPTTLAKLVSAAVWRITTGTAEQGVVSGLKKLPGVKQVSERAPRYGEGFSADAEYKAYASALLHFMKDTRDIMGKGRSDLDVLFGDRNDLGSGDAKQLDSSWVDYFGKLHAALKNPAKRAEFERSVAARAAFYGKQGIDIRDPMVQLRITAEAYQDAKKSIFMGNNLLVNMYKAGLRVTDTKNPETGKPYKLGKTIGTGLRIALPIVKVPTNIAMEVAEYAVGSVTGLVRLGVAFSKGIENLKPNEADAIMRNLAKGSLGGAALALGFFNPQAIGGYYQMGKKRPEGDVKAGSIKVYGYNIPSLLIHNPLLEVLQIGATIRRVADSKLHKKDKETQGIGMGALAGALGLGEQIPFVRETFDWSKLQNPYERSQFLSEYAKSLLEPGLLQTIAQQTDRTDGYFTGDKVDRKPKGFVQVMESGIPELRQNVPVKKK